jgi:NitT/TauT family transport system substrate-binding protein
MKLVPTFRRSHSLAPTLFCDLRKAMGTSKLTIPVPLFDLKSRRRTPRLLRGDFRSAVLVLTALLAVLAAAISPGYAQTTLDKVSFGTNWVAEAEHGGFFQAAADGTYERYGLDVTIVSGGPNENNRMLLIAGRLDFFMAANTLMSFDAVANNVPVVTVAAIFQKDPQVLLTHPDSKITKLEQLKPLTLFVSKEGISSYFQWLKSEYGFSENRVKPYTFNPQPFLADKHSAMQGYVTSEPYAVEKMAGFKPGIILLADYGFNTYSTLIETRRDLIDKKPDLVQRFVSASLIGWYNYLYGNNAAANAMIKKLNPEMTDELIAYSIARMKEYGIVDSGDALADGIGAMNDARMASFFDKMVRAHVVRPDIDYRKSYTLRFINKGVGLDLRPKN